MVDLTTGYNVPGVYVRDTTGPLVSTAGLPDAVVTLVGPSVGYQTITEQVVIGDTVSVLSKRGLWLSTVGAPSGVFVPRVTDSSGVLLTETDDYVIALDLSGGGGASNAVATIERGPDTDLAVPVIASSSTLDTGGSLVAGTYSYRVSAINASGETLASTADTQIVPAGTATNTVTINWGAVTGATGYKVYGRTAAGELLLATVGLVLTYTDTGAATPGGALPTVNTTSSTTVGGVAVGDTVVVTYCYTDSSYFTPLLFDDYSLVEATYGQALITTLPTLPTDPQIVSPLSLAAWIAMSNGANVVLCLATDPTDGDLRAQLVAAYEKLRGDYRIGTLVPVLADDDVDGSQALFQNYGSDLKVHVEQSADDGFPRVGIIGASNLYGTLAGVGAPPMDDDAASFASSRVVLAYPNKINLYNSAINRLTEISGYYLAAAYAGVLESNPTQQGLTRETVVGFGGFPASVTRYQTKQFKDRLSGGGVCVTEIDRQNRMVVRHGTSTDPTNVLTREVSITRGRDALYEGLQLGLDSSGLIGAPIDDEMTRRVQGAVVGILESLVSAGIVIAYDNVQVRQQTVETGGDPTVIEVKFAYKPAIPLNYILVSFAINLSTGETTLDANTQSQTFA